jgi:malonyl-CoA O-methyltransferase
MFSCLGPNTLRELRALYAAQGWPPPAQEFADMRDWGSRLLTAGFADPVMDTERITLTFETPARLLAELRELGRNLHPARHAALRTPRWRERLERALNQHLRPAGGGPLQLTFEILYGHALKAAPRRAVAGNTAIPLHEVRAQLRQRSHH